MQKPLKTEFAARRRRLMQTLGAGSVAIVATAPMHTRNRDSEYLFRPDSDFYYLTGFSEPDAVLVLIPGRKEGAYVLFCRERDPEKETWTGRRAGTEGAKVNFGADESHCIDEFGDTLSALLENKHSVYYFVGQDGDFDAQIMESVGHVRAKARSGVSAPTRFISLEQPLHEMRLRKSSQEIATMRKAAKVAAEAHVRAMTTCQPGQHEYMLEAEMAYTFRRHNCLPAYNFIVGGGENGCILHYNENDAVLRDGDLVLIDAGAEYGYYASDITRTFPVNGRFTTEQRALYELVLRAQLAAIEKIEPGRRWNEPHDAAVRTLTQGLIKLGLLKGTPAALIKEGAYRKFYMHRTGHWLGMDVHDVGEYKQNNEWRVFEPGMVLTVEPGLYIATNSENVDKKWWNIGIRIEDDVVVTKDGCEVLSSDAPKTVADIERLMATKK